MCVLCVSCFSTASNEMHDHRQRSCLCWQPHHLQTCTARWSRRGTALRGRCSAWPQCCGFPQAWWSSPPSTWRPRWRPQTVTQQSCWRWASPPGQSLQGERQLSDQGNPLFQGETSVSCHNRPSFDETLWHHHKGCQWSARLTERVGSYVCFHISTEKERKVLENSAAPVLSSGP